MGRVGCSYMGLLGRQHQLLNAGQGLTISDPRAFHRLATRTHRVCEDAIADGGDTPECTCSLRKAAQSTRRQGEAGSCRGRDLELTKARARSPSSPILSRFAPPSTSSFTQARKHMCPPTTTTTSSCNFTDSHHSTDSMQPGACTALLLTLRLAFLHFLSPVAAVAPVSAAWPATRIRPIQRVDWWWD